MRDIALYMLNAELSRLVGSCYNSLHYAINES